jgi:integrase
LFYVKGKPRSRRIGTYPDMTIAQARRAVSRFEPDKALARTEAGTFKTVAENWIVDHVDKKGLRSKYEIVRQLNTYVYPEWGGRKIFDINRKDVNDRLRSIEKKHGASQADAVLATITRVMKWYAVEDDRYTPAIIPGMKRDVQKKARHRTLDHQEIEDSNSTILEWHDRGEIRSLWAACGEVGPFGALVKLLLLTGQRLRKIGEMQWNDISGDGVWTIRSEKREKGNPGSSGYRRWRLT